MGSLERFQTMIDKYTKSKPKKYKRDYKNRVTLAKEIETMLGIEMNELMYIPRKGMLKLHGALREKLG